MSVRTSLLGLIDNKNPNKIDTGLRSFFYDGDTKIRDPATTLIQKMILLEKSDAPALSLIDSKDEYPYYRIAIDTSKDTKDIHHSYFLPPLQPKVATFIKAQEKYLDRLTGQQKDAIRAYTYYGDRMMNGFLRGSLQQENYMHLINAIRALRFVPFKTEILRRYPDLKRQFERLPIMGLNDDAGGSIQEWKEYGFDTRERQEFKFPSLSTLTIYNEESFTTIIQSTWFNSPENVFPMVKILMKDLIMAFNGLVAAVPRDYDLVVYRGVQSNHIKPGPYKSNDFWSTSLTPYVSMNFAADLGSTTFMIQELTVKPSTPCIYISKYASVGNNEWEVLLPPGVNYTVGTDVYMKRNIMPVDGEWALDDYLRKATASWIGEKKYVLVNELTAEGFDTNIPIIREIFGQAAERKKVLAQRVLVKRTGFAGKGTRHLRSKSRSRSRSSRSKN
jgi:ADP-ribosyltransferase exoenzyme